MATPTNQIPLRRVPDWTSIPIILVCLVGGGLIIHWYLMTDPASHESKITAPATTPAKQASSGQATAIVARRGHISRGTVQAGRNGAWSIHTELANAELSVVNGNVTFGSAVYNSYFFVPANVRSTIAGARSIINDSNWIEQLKLTPQQVAQLRALNERVTMILSHEDKDQLCKDLSAYVQSGERDRPTLEATLEQSLDDIADRSTAPTLQLARDRAAQINAIITPEIWKQYNSAGNRR